MRYDPNELFRSTGPYYACYRPGYPREFMDYLVTRFGLDGTQEVLDLGCGTGQIALPLAPHVARVVAVDPEPSMLIEGRHLAERRTVGNIDWIAGDSYRLVELDLPKLALVTMGASFHWMNRATVLHDLDPFRRLRRRCDRRQWRHTGRPDPAVERDHRPDPDQAPRRRAPGRVHHLQPPDREPR